MLFSRAALGGVALLALVAGTASAGTFTQNIYLTFSDPVGQREVRYVQPPTPADLGVLTYNTSIPLNLSFDFSDFGLPPALISSKLDLQVAVSPATPTGRPGEFVASTNGTFKYFRASDNALLIDGRFGDAALSVLRTSGGLTANGQMQSLEFSLTFTQVLVDELLLQSGYSFGGFDTDRTGDASWTLTGVSPSISLIRPPGGSEDFFANFTSNAAFSATIPVVPTPGVVSLVVAAGVLAMGARRR